MGRRPLPMVLGHWSANTDCMDDPLDRLFPVCAILLDDFETKPVNERIVIV